MSSAWPGITYRSKQPFVTTIHWSVSQYILVYPLNIFQHPDEKILKFSNEAHSLYNKQVISFSRSRILTTTCGSLKSKRWHHIDWRRANTNRGAISWLKKKLKIRISKVPVVPVGKTAMSNAICPFNTWVSQTGALGQGYYHGFHRGALHCSHHDSKLRNRGPK